MVGLPMTFSVNARGQFLTKQYRLKLFFEEYSSDLKWTAEQSVTQASNLQMSTSFVH